MQGHRTLLFIAAAATVSVFASTPARAATMPALKGAYAAHNQANVEQVARRCRYDRRGRLRCRGSRYRTYRRYDYDPYGYYGYYPRYYGYGYYGRHHHYHHHGHGHHHGHH